jgi:hypothetical protein
MDYSMPPYKWWRLVAELTCHLQGYTPLDKILLQNLQAVADQGYHFKGSSPYKEDIYIGGYTVSVFCTPNTLRDWVNLRSRPTAQRKVDSPQRKLIM